MSTHGSGLWRIIASTLLLLACASGFSSATAPPQEVSWSWHSPTKTYQGFLSIVYYGIYQVVTTTPVCRANFPPCLDSDQVVFYLISDNGLRVRLIFYCGPDICRQSKDVPLDAGARVYAKGTLIEPSQWQSQLFEPLLYFVGDLYVFQYHTA